MILLDIISAAFPIILFMILDGPTALTLTADSPTHMPYYISGISRWDFAFLIKILLKSLDWFSFGRDEW